MENTEYQRLEEEKKRTHLETDQQKVQSELEKQRLSAQEITTLSKTIEEQIQEKRGNLANLLESLPDDIRDPLMERMDAVKGLLQKFDKQAGGTGTVFTTIDRAFDMAWLSSLRTLARDKKRIGHGVKVKFDIGLKR